MKFLVLLFSLLGLGGVLASDLDFVLVNDTDRSFEAVYISAAGDRDWDGNLLADGMVLKAGGQVMVKFPADAKSPDWDVNVVDDAGLAVRFDAVQLTGANKLTLKESQGKITVEVE